MITNNTFSQIRQTAGAAIIAVGVLSLPSQAAMHQDRQGSNTGHTYGATNRTPAASRPANTQAPSPATSHRSGNPTSGSNGHVMQPNPGMNRPAPSSNGNPGWSNAGRPPVSNTYVNVYKNNTYVNRGGDPRNNGSHMNHSDGHNGGQYVNRFDGGRAPAPAFAHSGDVRRSFRHSIPDHHFRSYFGRDHEFRIRRPALIGPAPMFRFGGIGFRLGTAWPMAWSETDALYVDYTGGAYYLCNRLRPGIRIPVDVAECDSCTPAPVAECDTCAAPSELPLPEAPVPTLNRGQSAYQVVSMLGNPKNVVNLGNRQIYLYDNMKVTLVAGTVVDVR